METNVDSLILEVTSSTTGATNGLKALSESLTALKTAASGKIGLAGVVSEIKGATDAAGQIKSSSTNKLNKAIDALSRLKGVNISPSLGTNIASLSTALENANFDNCADKVEEVVDALKPLEKLEKSNLNSYVKSLNEMPSAFTALAKVDIAGIGVRIRELANALRPLGTELNSVTNGLKLLAPTMQIVSKNTQQVRLDNLGASESYIRFAGNVKTAIRRMSNAARVIKKCVESSSAYTETMNMFTVSMGQYAQEAYDYAQTVSGVMGVDPKDWMKNQSYFMTISKGFGVASDRAAEMSKNLTQLGYDIASFNDIKVEDAMLKLQSGLAGELEPLRRIGYDLSQAKLEAIALSLGIDKSVSSMTQAEKAELRYYAILTQVTDAHGDMARTLDSPANQIRILTAQIEMLRREVGNALMPVLKAVLPYAIATVKMLRELAVGFGELLGADMDTPDFASTAESAASANAELEDTEEQIKKLQSITAGFDELNIIGSNNDISDALGGSNFDFPLQSYDFLGGLDEQVNAATDKIKGLLGVVATVGVGIAAWKISKSLISGLDTVSGIMGRKSFLDLFKPRTITWSFSAIGLALFVDDLDKLFEYIDDIQTNGLDVSNVAGALSEFAGLMGDACLVLGNLKTAGALKAVQGIGEIVSGIADICDNGANFDNVTDIVRGLSNLALAIGAFTGNIKLIGGAAAIQGFTGIIEEIGKNWEAIKSGDWSGVDKASLIIDVVTVIAGVAVALGALNKVSVIKGKNPISMVTESVSSVGSSTSAFSKKAPSMMKDIALGGAMLVEIAAVAAVFIGSLLVIGKLLDEMADSWTPLLDKGEAVTSAVTLGTSILLAVGTATMALGKMGKNTAKDITIGSGVLVEIGAVASVYLLEITAIGAVLKAVADVWQPLLDRGDEVTSAIELGSAIMLAVGAATMALGNMGKNTVNDITVGSGVLLAVTAVASLYLLEIMAIGAILGTVADVWQPLIDRGDEVTSAIELGSSIMLAVGTATMALGKMGKNVAMDITVGSGVLVEIGAVASLYLLEITALGAILSVVADVWQPLIDKGDTITAAIELGTSILLAVGAVTAVLGATGKTMVANVGYGSLVLGEIALAASAYLLEIAAIGAILGTVADVWQPLVDKGDTITAAIELGTSILLAVGGVTIVLGKVGKSLLDEVLIGTAVLGAISLATVVITSAITSVGDNLVAMGEAWSPVLANGWGIVSTLGVALLIIGAFGLAAYGIGVLTIAGGWAIPAAIALGTLMIVGIVEAVKLMINSITSLCNSLTKNLSPSLSSMVVTLPGVSANMKTYSSFMSQFGLEVAGFSANSAISGISSTIGSIIGFFTGDPVSNMAKNIRSQNGSFTGLIKQLTVAIPNILKAAADMRRYHEALADYSAATGGGTFSSQAIGGKVSGLVNSIKTSLSVAGFSIPGFAEGGFPNEGQLFIARESGAEMVGNIGRRTAVANNDQIVSGIASGVAEANGEQNVLLREQNNLLRALLQKDGSVYLDGRLLTNSVEKYQRERGKVVVSGGVI